MEESPLRLAIDGEPVPDVFVVSDSEADYRERHPIQAEVVLVAEVSNTAAEYDLYEKAMLSAQSGIADCWAALANDGTIVVHRQPSAEDYQDVTRLTGADTLSPLVIPGAAWMIDALIGREE